MPRLTGKPHGQVLIEFAIAVLGIVMFIHVIVGVFTWFNRTLIERNRTFQRSRAVAGRYASQGGDPGQRTFYARTPIKLGPWWTPTESVSGPSGFDMDPELDPANQAVCPAAQGLLTQAAAVRSQIASLYDPGKNTITQINTTEQHIYEEVQEAVRLWDYHLSLIDQANFRWVWAKWADDVADWGVQMLPVWRQLAADYRQFAADYRELALDYEGGTGDPGNVEPDAADFDAKANTLEDLKNTLPIIQTCLADSTADVACPAILDILEDLAEYPGWRPDIQNEADFDNAVQHLRDKATTYREQAASFRGLADAYEGLADLYEATANDWENNQIPFYRQLAIDYRNQAIDMCGGLFECGGIPDTIGQYEPDAADYRQMALDKYAHAQGEAQNQLTPLDQSTLGTPEQIAELLQQAKCLEQNAQLACQDPPVALPPCN